MGLCDGDRRFGGLTTMVDVRVEMCVWEVERLLWGVLRGGRAVVVVIDAG